MTLHRRYRLPLCRHPPHLLLLATLLAASCGDAPPAPGGRDAYGPLPAEVGGYRVTRGAAPGYVADASCKDCHEELFESYREVGMARSVYRLTKETAVEDFGRPFFQEATRFHYVTYERDGKYYQQRYCEDDDGRPFARHEVEIAWVIGSGNHARTYAYRTDYGELYELPVSWYAETGWQMSPGYEWPRHERFERPIQRDCMFCHNAYPEVPAGADLPSAPHRFPSEMPHGIGCQRCHGPGARHVEAALSSDVDPDEISKRILNPARFPPALREELCMTCHMQPDASSGADSISRAFGRPVFAHTPDQSILDYVVYFDFGSQAERAVKLEINHHAHRMRQSACYTASDGKLGCLSCHDPHEKVKTKERPAFYRARCVGCHDLGDCRMDGMGTTHDPAAADCAGCHMPESRPRDVVQTTITDHKIQRPPEKGPAAPRARRREPPPADVEVVPCLPSRGPKGPLLEVHRLLAKSVFLGAADVPALTAALRRADPAGPDAWVRAGAAIEQAGDLQSAISVLRDGLRKFPADPALVRHLAMALHRSGENAEARRRVGETLAIERHPRAVELLGNLLVVEGELAAARAAFEEALALRPVRANTWRRYAHVLEALGDPDAAAGAFRAAIARDPDVEDAYRNLFRVHLQRGAPDDALRALAQGATRSVALRLDLVGQLCSADARLRDFDAAERHARRACSQDPDNGRAHLFHAFTLAARDRLAEAERAAERARRLGADPACCTGIALIGALRRNERARIDDLLARYEREARVATDEPLRAPIRSTVAALMARRR